MCAQQGQKDEDMTRGTRQDKSVRGCDEEEAKCTGTKMNLTSLSNLGGLKPGFEVDVNVRVQTKGWTNLRAKERRGEMPRHEGRKT